MSVPAIDLSSAGKRHTFERTIARAERIHAGETRLRDERFYVCHPLELIALHQEFSRILYEGGPEETYSQPMEDRFQRAAQEIAARAAEFARMNKQQLIRRVLNGAEQSWIGEQEMVVGAGFGLHDTEESIIRLIRKIAKLGKPEAAWKAAGELAKYVSGRMRKAGNRIFPGAGEIVHWLTDEWRSPGGEDKDVLQRKWGSSPPRNWYDLAARNCKQMDYIVNLVDLPMIPEEGRKPGASGSREWKIDYVQRMKRWTDEAQGVHPLLKQAFYNIYFEVAREFGIPLRAGAHAAAKHRVGDAAREYGPLVKAHPYARFEAQPV